MHLTKTKHIFIAGTFIAHPLTQKIVTEEFEKEKWDRAMFFDDIVSTNDDLIAFCTGYASRFRHL